MPSFCLEFLAQLSKTLPDILLQVPDILHADTEPNKRPVHRFVTHRPPFYQTLHSAQGSRMVEVLQETR